MQARMEIQSSSKGAKYLRKSSLPSDKPQQLSVVSIKEEVYGMKCKCGNVLTEDKFSELFESSSSKAKSLIAIVLDETEKGCCRSEASRRIIGIIEGLEWECEELQEMLDCT